MTRRRVLARLHGASPQGGFTLVELLVAGVLMAFMGVLVATTVVGGLRTSARGERRTDESAAAQRALLALTTDVRASAGGLAGFVSAGPTGFSLNTRSTGAATSGPTDTPERVTYALTAGALVQTRQALDPATQQPTGTATTRTLVTGVLDPSVTGRPLFRYLSAADSQRQCLTGPTTNLNGTVALPDIYSVDIWLSISTSPDPADPPLVVPGGAVVLNQGALALQPAYTSSLGLGQGC